MNETEQGLLPGLSAPLPLSPTLSRRVWLGLILLGFAGQLAWGVENQFFNTFMYDNITPDPRPISWMVAASAATATLLAALPLIFTRKKERSG